MCTHPSGHLAKFRQACFSFGSFWKPLFERPATSESEAVIHLMAEYSERELTHETDILNALAGILHAAEENFPAFAHYWGVPVLRGIVSCKKDESCPPKSNSSLPFMLGLSWSHDRRSAGLIERRNEFPSWSWAGWKAPLYSFAWDRRFCVAAKCLPLPAKIPASELIFCRDLNVKIEMLDSTLVDSSDVQEHKVEASQLSRYLHVTAPTTPILVERTSVSEEQPGIHFLHGRGPPWTFCIPSKQPSTEPLPGLALHLMSFNKIDAMLPGGGAMRVEYLLVALVDGVYERLGIFSWHSYDLDVDKLMDGTVQTIRIG